MTTPINHAMMKLTRRAEANIRSKLVETFVDVGPLFTLLSSKDHQVLYGRRGTGKTHVLSYLAQMMEKNRDCVIYLDLRTVGSAGVLYANDSPPTAHRATRLLGDTLNAVHEGLYQYFHARTEDFDLSVTAPLLDQLADAITEVSVVGTVERVRTATSGAEASQSSSIGLSVGKEGVNLTLGDATDQKQSGQVERRLTESGTAEYRVHLGSVGMVFSEIARAMQPRRTWLLLDEWSSVPNDLQPYLADLLRRSIFPVQNVTVKIAAVEQRSQFRFPTGRGDYLGIELGADASADLNLDDFMVFDNDADRATIFFKELLFRHMQVVEDADIASGPRNSDELVAQGFTQRSVFDEFVRATEGVPRDAINIISHAAQRALDDKISMNHLRVAARNWYQRDKYPGLRGNNRADDLLHWIIDIVIGTRRARAFLLRNDVSHELIDVLFDARVLHVLKRNISGRDQPGVRYDVYKLDYGCYVDLINTAKAPLGLLLGIADSNSGQVRQLPLTGIIDATENTGEVLQDENLLRVLREDDLGDVPQDDYRAIRRAILNIQEFETRRRA